MAQALDGAVSRLQIFVKFSRKTEYSICKGVFRPIYFVPAFFLYDEKDGEVEITFNSESLFLQLPQSKYFQLICSLLH